MSHNIAQSDPKIEISFDVPKRSEIIAPQPKPHKLSEAQSEQKP